MMASATSRVNHRHLAPSVLQLRYASGVRELLNRHRKCVPGDGHRPESCSAKRQLLAIAELRRWHWA